MGKTAMNNDATVCGSLGFIQWDTIVDTQQILPIGLGLISLQSPFMTTRSLKPTISADASFLPRMYTLALFLTSQTSIWMMSTSFSSSKTLLVFILMHTEIYRSQVLDRSVVLVASVCTEKEFKYLLARHVGLVQSHTTVRPQTRQSLKCADHNNVYCAWKVCILSCLRILSHEEHVDSFFPELQCCSSTNCLLVCWNVGVDWAEGESLGPSKPKKA